MRWLGAWVQILYAPLIMLRKELVITAYDSAWYKEEVSLSCEEVIELHLIQREDQERVRGREKHLCSYLEIR